MTKNPASYSIDRAFMRAVPGCVIRTRSSAKRRGHQKLRRGPSFPAHTDAASRASDDTDLVQASIRPAASSSGDMPRPRVPPKFTSAPASRTASTQASTSSTILLPAIAA